MSMPVILTGGNPLDIRPVMVDANEVIVSTQPSGGRKRCVQIGTGNVSVPALLAALSDYGDPSLLMVHWGIECDFMPGELEQVTIPKVFVIGDTHHMAGSLKAAVEMALRHPWQLVVMQHNPYHMLWFTIAGVYNTVHIPCFSVNPVDMPVPERRTRGVTFVGNLGAHPKRLAYIEGLRKRGIEVQTFGGLSKEETAKIYNESVVSLNISLNGDFNMRNYEIPAAGGKLVSDHMFGSLNGIASACRWYLERPELSLLEAKRKYLDFWANQSPVNKINHLHQALATGYAPTSKPPSSLWDRIDVYEDMQELCRTGRWRPEDVADLKAWNLEAL